MKHEAQDTRHGTRILVMAGMMVGAASALAMPSKDELNKAKEKVQEHLMKEDIKAYYAKIKTAQELGDISFMYAQEARTEAEKFMLLKGAISYYVRGESYDKAADAVNALREAVPDVEPCTLEEIIRNRKNTVRFTVKNAPRLYSIYRTVQVQAEAVKEVVVAKAALAKKPKDEAAIRKLAEAQALSGDWKTALGTFAQMGNKVGTMAKSESEGKDLAAVANYWWDYKSYLGEKDADAFKAHAAGIYRRCLDEGTIDGLDKRIAEKCLKRMENVPVAATAASDEVRSISRSGVCASGGKAWQEKGNTAMLTLRNGEKLEFVKCPAGDIYYRIGLLCWERYNEPKTKRAKISRPFWIMTRPLAKRNLKMYEQFNAKWQGRDDQYDYVQINHRDAESFAETLTDEVRESLPRGYVVRNPSFAEFEYAIRANSHSPSDPYCNFDNFYDEVAKKIFVNDPQGKSPKNEWGVHEFFMKEQLLDKFSDENSVFECWGKDKKRMGPSKLTSIHIIRWNPVMTVDPLVWTENPDRLPAWRRLDRCNGIVMTCIDALGQCRLVVGPDLVSEWKAKNAKK